MNDERFLYVAYSENDYEQIDNIFLELFKNNIKIKAQKDVEDSNRDSLLTDSEAMLFVVSSSSIVDNSLIAQVFKADACNKNVIPYFLEDPSSLNISNDLLLKMNGTAAIPAYEYTSEADIVKRALSEIRPYFPENVPEKPKKKRHAALAGIAVVICALLFIYNHLNKSSNREAALDNVSNSTVMIYSLDYLPKSFDEVVFDYIGSGSGFFINSTGKIVTNYHVIDGASYLCIKPFNSDEDEYYFADVEIFDDEIDLAVLQISADYYTDYYLPIADNKVKTGDVIYVSGYPMGIDHTISNGIVSNDCHYVPFSDFSDKFYIVTAAVSPGNSGGPAVNENGQIIGITTAKYNDAENVNLVRPVSYLIELLK